MAFTVYVGIMAVVGLISLILFFLSGYYAYLASAATFWLCAWLVGRGRV